MIKTRLAVAALALMLSACTTPSNVTVDAAIGIDSGTPTVVASPQPIVTVTPWATSQPASTNPIRVNFAIGTYGATLTGNGNQAYLLWARGGQVMTVKPSSEQPLNISLLAPDKTQVVVEVVDGVGNYKLPTNGDYTLSFVTGGGFGVAVEIRP